MDELGADPQLEPGPLDLAEVQRILGRIEGVVRERHVVLVGGQAVVVWFGQLQDRLRSDIAAAQVASRDLDLLGGAQDARRAAELLDGEVHLSRWEDRTPLTGVAIFVDGDGHERRLDVLRSAYGMRSDDIRKTAIEVDVRLDDGRRVPIWVMHPERCMESRVHNRELHDAPPAADAGPHPGVARAPIKLTITPEHRRRPEEILTEHAALGFCLPGSLSRRAL